MRLFDAFKGKSSRSLMDNNKFVFVLSLLIAVVCWGSISLVNTKETERTISGVKVQLTQTEELLVIHGYNSGQKLRDMVRGRLKHPRIQSKLLSLNPGQTRILLKK